MLPALLADEINNFSNKPVHSRHNTQLMYALKNKVQLIGHLGAKPEVKKMESGKKRAVFSIATSESFRNTKGEKQTETQWHRIVAWGKIADIAEQYLDKGKEVAIEGKLTNRHYEDKEGNRRFVTEIVVMEILLIGSKMPA